MSKSDRLTNYILREWLPLEESSLGIPIQLTLVNGNFLKI